MHANCVKADPWPHGYEWELNALLCVCALHMRARLSCENKIKTKKFGEKGNPVSCRSAFRLQVAGRGSISTVLSRSCTEQLSSIPILQSELTNGATRKAKKLWCLGTFHSAWHKQNCHLQILQEQSSILLQYRKPVETFVCTAPNSQITNFNTVSHFNRDEHMVCEWWEGNKSQFPLLYNLAAKYLAIPATSASSERSFLKAGLTIGKLRTRLTGQHIDEINFLHCNSSLLWFLSMKFSIKIKVKKILSRILE